MSFGLIMVVNRQVPGRDENPDSNVYTGKVSA